MSQEQEQEFNNEDEIEVNVHDDTPEGDQGHAPMPDPEPGQDDDDDDAELTDVSERVKRRIAKLTAQKHDARRKSEAAEREAAEAAQATKLLLDELNRQRQINSTYEGGFVEQARGRVEAEIAEAKREFKAAFEVGDADKMAEAQDRIARLAPQHEQFSRYKPREVQPIELPQAPRPQHNPQADENLSAFMAENPWFNQDQDMTAYAMGLHTQTASQNPEIVGTKEYYDTIANRVKAAFAHKMAPEQRRPSASPVTPAVRGNPSQPRKQITLTSSQVRLAQRLGLTPQQYAAEILKGNQ